MQHLHWNEFRWKGFLIFSWQIFNCHFSDLGKPVIVTFNADTVFFTPLGIAKSTFPATVNDIQPVLDAELFLGC